MSRFLLAIIFLSGIGCAGTELAVGGGRQFGGSTLASSGSHDFEDNQDESSSANSFTYDQDDVDSLWMELRFQLSPTQVELIDPTRTVSPVAVPPPAPVIIDHRDDVDAGGDDAIEIAGVGRFGKDTNPVLIAALALLVLALGLMGYLLRKSVKKKK